MPTFRPAERTRIPGALLIVIVLLSISVGGGQVLKILIEIYGCGEYVRIHTGCVLLAVGRFKSGLYLDAPESGVGLGESDADFPSFVSAPDDFALRTATCLGQHKPNLPAERHVRANNCHAAGVADINGQSICGAARFAFIPL